MPPPDSRRTPNGGAHWPRPTGILPASYPMSKPCHCEPARGLVWQSVFPLCRTITTRGNGFPRRFAPRNDSYTKILLPSVGRGDHTSPPDNARHSLQCFRRGRRPRRPADNAPHPRKNPVIARSEATWQSALPLRRTPSLSPPHFCPFPAKIFPFFPLTGKIACGIFTVLIRIVHLTHRKEA